MVHGYRPTGLTGVGAAALMAVLLAGCDTTSGGSATYQSGGFAQQTSTGADGAFSISFTDANAYAGRWTLTDRFARRCGLTLTTEREGRNYRANREGFCSFEFENVHAWSPAGPNIVLSDANGRMVGMLSSDGAGGYQGTFQQATFGTTTDVTLRRGMF